MTTFCIQVQPDRAPDLDMERVRSLCRLISSRRALVVRHSIAEGVDKGRYVNLMFDTAQPRELWGMLHSIFYEDAIIGSGLALASMAMCEGDQGWDDYRLLHHFDPEVETDTL